MVGWAALTPYSNREVYKGVAEISIYILNGYQGTGIGSILLSNLIIEREAWDLDIASQYLSTKPCKSLFT